MSQQTETQGGECETAIKPIIRPWRASFPYLGNSNARATPSTVAGNTIESVVMGNGSRPMMAMASAVIGEKPIAK